MHEKKDSFESLENKLLDTLTIRGYTPITISGYRKKCNNIFSWLKDHGYDSYSKENGMLFLQSYLKENGENQYYKDIRTVVFRLNDITDGTWINVHSDKSKHFDLPDEFIKIIEKYCNNADAVGLAKGTVRIKRYAVSWFLSEASLLGCNSLKNLSPDITGSACIKITDHNLWGEVRCFLKYLADFNIIEKDFSTFVPHYSKPKVIPSVYSIDEIQQIEGIIDTESVLGKRDYAMILLASRMGLRSGDIARLKIEDISHKDSIDIIQEKTGKPLHLPVIKEVREAIDDYLTVRPESDLKQLFLNVQAPHNAVSAATLRHALSKYIKDAGIDTGNRKHGPHSLRSSLASSMVNNDIAYETVRKVLGHSSENAIKHYARIDIEKLRRYSLAPPDPSGNFRAFLYGEVK